MSYLTARYWVWFIAYNWVKFYDLWSCHFDFQFRYVVWSGLASSSLLKVESQGYMHHPSLNMLISHRINAFLQALLSPIFDGITPSVPLFSFVSSLINPALKNVGTEIVASDDMAKILYFPSFDGRHQLRWNRIKVNEDKSSNNR